MASVTRTVAHLGRVLLAWLVLRLFTDQYSITHTLASVLCRNQVVYSKSGS